jgi:hypothetical protein
MDWYRKIISHRIGGNKYLIFRPLKQYFWFGTMKMEGNIENIEDWRRTAWLAVASDALLGTYNSSIQFEDYFRVSSAARFIVFTNNSHHK